MKTMKRNDDVIRVSEEDVDKHLSMSYGYCQKKEWKTKVRDFNKKEEKSEKSDSDKTEDKPKKTKRIKS
jgi:hypothetical protein